MRLNDSNLTGSFAIVQRGFKHLSEVMRSFLKASDFHVKNRDFSKKNKTLLCNNRALLKNNRALLKNNPGLLRHNLGLLTVREIAIDHKVYTRRIQLVFTGYTKIAQFSSSLLSSFRFLSLLTALSKSLSSRRISRSR